jgi:hypothetical protein
MVHTFGAMVKLIKVNGSKINYMVTVSFIGLMVPIFMVYMKMMREMERERWFGIH